MPIIKLTQGQVTRVDQRDYDELNKFKWYADRQKKGNYYAVRNVRVDGKQTMMYLHRVILGCKHGEQCDHKDHDTLNNQRNNLRIVTHHQNQRNQKSNKNSSSKYKGVCFHKQTGKWQATIKVNNKSIYLGLFFTEEEAALAYNKKAIEIDPEHFYINKIEKKGRKKE